MKQMGLGYAYVKIAENVEPVNNNYENDFA